MKMTVMTIEAASTLIQRRSICCIRLILTPTFEPTMTTSNAAVRGAGCLRYLRVANAMLGKIKAAPTAWYQPGFSPSTSQAPMAP